MASKPYPEKRNGKFTGRWIMKIRLGLTWKKQVLGPDARLLSAKPPKTPPQTLLDRHHEFEEMEYNDRHGIAKAPLRAKGLPGYLESYVEAYAHSHKHGPTCKLRMHVKRFEAFAENAGARTVQDITRKVCRDYLEHRAKTVAHDTVKNEASYLRPIWSRAVEDGLVAANPWAKLKVPGKSTKRSGTAWTPGEVLKIVGACKMVWHADLVLFMVNTGLRISTALAAKWDWIEWSRGEAGAIKIPREQAANTDGVKTAYTHLLSPFANSLLARRLAQSTSDYLFPGPRNDGEGIHYGTARQAIQNAIDRARVKKGLPHDLRRTYATQLYQATRDLDYVRRQLGHSSIVTTQIYLGIVESDNARSLEGFTLGEVIPSAGPDQPPESK